MPVVPVYERPQVQGARPRTERLPTPYAQPETATTQAVTRFGAGLERASDQVGQLQAHNEAVAERERHKHEVALTQEVETALSQWSINQTQAAQKLRGRNAIGVADKGLVEFDKVAEKLSERFREAAPEQAARIRKAVADRRMDLQRHLVSYESAQSDVVAKEAYEGSVQAAISDAANDPFMLGAGANAEKRLLAQVDERARQQGWSKEQMLAEAVRGTTALHLGVLDRLADVDPARARAYLEANAAWIDGEERGKSKIDKRLAAKGVEQQALGVVRRIQSGYADLGAQLEEARKIGDVSLQDEVVKRLEHDALKQKQLLDEAEKQRKGRVFQMIEDGLPNWRTSKDFVELSDDGKADALQKSAQVDARRRGLTDAEKRAQREEDQLALNQFNALSDEAQRTLDLKTRFGSRVSENGMALLELQQKRTVEDYDKGLIPERQEFDDQVRGALKPGMNKKAAELILTSMRGWRARYYKTHNGQGPTRDEVDAQIAWAVNDVNVTRRWMWDKTVKGYQVTDEELPRAAPQPPATKKPAAKLVPVQGPNGQKGLANEEGLDEWLAGHPGWRKR